MVNLNASFPVVQEKEKQNIELWSTVACRGTSLLILGEQSWRLQYAGEDRDKGHSYSLPALVLWFLSVSPFSSLWGHLVRTGTRLLLGGARFRRLELNWLNFKSFWGYFWNIMNHLYIPEPGPNPRQNEWHSVQAVLLFLEHRACPLSGCGGGRAGWRTLGFMLLVRHSLSTSPREPCTRAQEGWSFSQAGVLSDTTIGVTAVLSQKR